MSLDEELRSAFEQEARTRVAPPPDPAGLIRGGRARRRRRTLERVGTAAAGAALVVAGGLGLQQLWVPGAPSVSSPPSGTADGSTLPDPFGRSELAPGTYRRVVGYSAAGPRIEADFTVDGNNWSDGDFPLAAEGFGSVFAGVGVYQPRAIAAGNGCLDGATTSDLGGTPRRLASQLARLPRSAVLQAPVAVRAFGYSGRHLRLRIDASCRRTYYRVAESPMGDRGITYTQPDADKDVVIDFWVLDVAGTMVVVDQWHTVDASDALVAQTDRTRDSIVLVVGD
jgi:hypothetical protein